jgi:hypothetical protein
MVDTPGPVGSPETKAIMALGGSNDGATAHWSASLVASVCAARPGTPSDQVQQDQRDQRFHQPGATAGWNRFVAAAPSHTKSAMTRSWVITKGGSFWVGAAAIRAGVLPNSCTTRTKAFK